VCGADVMQSKPVQSFALNYTLQLYASSHDHFEDRMSHEPYTLLCLPDPPTTTPNEHKRAAVQAFFRRAGALHDFVLFQLEEAV